MRSKKGIHPSLPFSRCSLSNVFNVREERPFSRYFFFPCLSLLYYLPLFILVTLYDIIHLLLTCSFHLFDPHWHFKIFYLLLLCFFFVTLCDIIPLFLTFVPFMSMTIFCMCLYCFCCFHFLLYLFTSVSFSSSSLSQYSLSFPLLLSVNFSLSHWMCMSQESLRKSESSRWKNTKRSFKPKDCCVSWCIFSIKHGNKPKCTKLITYWEG